eukprot:6207222-Pleurochrysis_carterae.AAC.1
MSISASAFNSKYNVQVNSGDFNGLFVLSLPGKLIRTWRVSVQRESNQQDQAFKNLAIGS